MSLYKDRKSGHWYVSISVPGQPRIRRSTGTADRAQAQRIHDQWKAQAWQRRHTGHTWQDAAVLWLTHGSRSATDRYRIRIITERLGNPPLAEITTEHLTRALAHVRSAGTWNRYRTLVLAILNLAHAHGWIETTPRLPSRKTPPCRTRWLTREEWQRLLAELPPHLVPPARFAIATGLRRANLLDLRWDQIDLARRVMWIHPDKAKARKAIGIPLSDTAMQVLREQRGQHPTHVFHYKGRPMKEIGEAFNRAVRRAGLSDVNWHTLRHTWASWHIMAGTPIEVLQKLGGWNSLQMVLRYAHLAPEYLAAWANNSDKNSDRATPSDTVLDGFLSDSGSQKAA